MKESPWLLILDEEKSRRLLEGAKSISSHEDPQSLARKLGLQFSEENLVGRSVGMSAAYRNLKASYRRDLGNAFNSGNLRPVIERYFGQAYALGVHSQGVGSSIVEVLKELTDADKDYLRKAVEEELEYAHAFLEEIDSGVYDEEESEEGVRRMNPNVRLDLYIQGLDGLYQTGVLSVLPPTMVLEWVGPWDKNKCESCRYLASHGPYVKESLPTVPRAGDTLCISRCRDIIIARPGRPNEASILRANAHDDIIRHIDALNRIKRKRRNHSQIPYPSRKHEVPKGRETDLDSEPTFRSPGKPKYDIMTRSKRYVGDSVEEKPVNSKLLFEKSLNELHRSEELDEEVLQAVAAFRGIGDAKAIMNQMKSLGSKLDFVTTFMVVSISPSGATDQLVKAGPISDMVRWIARASDIHEKVFGTSLNWSFLGISTFRDQVEDLVHKFHSHWITGTAVWVGGATDDESIVTILMTAILKKEPRHQDVMDLLDVYKGKKNREEIELVTGHRSTGKPSTSLMKYLLGRMTSPTSFSVNRNADESHTLNGVKRNGLFKEDGVDIYRLMHIGGISALRFVKGSLKVLYNALAGIHFINIFPVIAVYPLSIKDEEGHAIQISPVLLSGPIKWVIEWIGKANEIHQELHGGKPLSYEVLGMSSFRYQVNDVLQNASKYITGAGAKWIDNPEDNDAIALFITGERPLEDLYPSLAQSIMKNRIRRNFGFDTKGKPSQPSLPTKPKKT